MSLTLASLEKIFGLGIYVDYILYGSNSFYIFSSSIFDLSLFENERLRIIV